MFTQEPIRPSPQESIDFHSGSAQLAMVAFFAGTARFVGAAGVLDPFGAIDVFVDFAGFFARTRKFSGFVVSIPMTRR
jgi:hypothetical protein